MNRRRRAMNSSIIPGMTDDVAELCLTRVPRSSIRTLARVCRRWRSFVESERFAAVRKSAGVVEDFLCILMWNGGRTEMYWEVFDTSGNKLGQIPPVPGPAKQFFGLTVLDGRKIVLIGGLTLGRGFESVLADVYEFDPGVNRWRKLADLNVPRFGFTCAEVNGLLYVIGGRSRHTASFSNAEVYNPDTNRWSLIECPNSPPLNSFAFSFNFKLYVIGNDSKFINVYDPKTQTWHELNTERSIKVCSYTVLRNNVYFMDMPYVNVPYCLQVFDPAENLWSSVSVPRGVSGLSVRLVGVWNDKVLLFCRDLIFSRIHRLETLMYDPYEEIGSEWKACDQINPSGLGVDSILIGF